MSRAFVKESDGESFQEEVPERPQSPHPNYITRAGLERLRATLGKLRAERAAVDSESVAAKPALARLEREIRYLEARLERAIPVDPRSQPADEVAFGAEVRVRDEDGSLKTFRIVGEDEADAASGKVSWISPLARALMGARAGDVILWERPAGERELEVVAIHYPGD